MLLVEQNKANLLRGLLGTKIFNTAAIVMGRPISQERSLVANKQDSFHQLKSVNFESWPSPCLRSLQELPYHFRQHSQRAETVLTP